MRALFNGHCSRCKHMKPRCARVFTRDPMSKNLVGCRNLTLTVEQTMCEDCRKVERGQYRVHSQHRRKRS